MEVYDRYVKVYKHGELLSQISCPGTVWIVIQKGSTFLLLHCGSLLLLFISSHKLPKPMSALPSLHLMHFLYKPWGLHQAFITGSMALQGMKARQEKKILKLLTRTPGPSLIIRAVLVKCWYFQQSLESHTLPLNGKQQLCSDGCSRLQYFLFPIFTASNKYLPCFLLSYCSQRVYSWVKNS